MTNRIVEAKIILLLWLFSASVVSYSTVSTALGLYSETAAFENSTQTHADYTGEPCFFDEISPSFVGWEENELG